MADDNNCLVNLGGKTFKAPGVHVCFVGLKGRETMMLL